MVENSGNENCSTKISFSANSMLSLNLTITCSQRKLPIHVFYKLKSDTHTKVGKK